MHRFLVSSKDIVTDKAVIVDKNTLHHMRDVLYLKAGDEVVIFDEAGREYSARIEGFTKEQAVLKSCVKLKPRIDSQLKITVACALPKNCKIDDIIDKLTQLGVDRIIPMQTQRVIVKLDAKKKIERQKRWEKIALSAAEQSQRNSVPVVEPVQSIEEVLSRSLGYDLKLIPNLEGERMTLKEAISQRKARDILVFIGPEGDFSPEELALAFKSGCIPVSLGPLVLRVDTAAIAAASFIMLNEKS